MSGLNQEAPLYCICRSSEINVFMIGCDFCEEWFHGDCIGITEKESETINKFCCKLCKRKNPALQTTYKKVTRKNSTKTIGKNKKLTLLANIVEADTIIPKAEIEDYRKFKQSLIPEQTKMTDKRGNEKITLKQCYGPGCTKASRIDSKYCSDACGIMLAKHRILEILPQRIQQWNSTPCAADDLNRMKLSSIRAMLCKIEKQVVQLDEEIKKLIKNIASCKSPANDFIEIQCDATTSTDCVLCGAEISNKFIERHLEQCYMKLEKRITADDKLKPSDEKWNIFCNRKISKNSWCKKMKVLCPFHYVNFRKANEVCGYYLGKENGIDKFCGNKGRTCSHLNWEEIQRAMLDLEKLKLLLQFNDLKDEEERIRKEMARRGDILSLMCNYTVEHNYSQK